jgi:AcrR family transcriptional regulator
VPDSNASHVSRSDVERNRQALLAAAAEELARNPGASMVDIATAAHLTRATLYRHFGTREQLVEGLQAQALDHASRALADSRLEEGPALAALHRAIDVLAALGPRFRPLLVEGADLDPDFQARRAVVLDPLREVVRRGQAEGEIRADLTPEWVVTALASLLAAGVRSVPADGPRGVALAGLVYRTLVDGIQFTARN